MAKKTHVKVRLVPEAKPDSAYYYVKKPAGGEKALKLKAKKYNPIRKHETFIEKNYHLTASNYFFKVSFLKSIYHKSY